MNGRGHVEGSATLLGHHTALGATGKSKVSHHVAVVMDEGVLRLNVSMGEVILDHLLETLEDVIQDGQGLLFRDTAPLGQ